MSWTATALLSNTVVICFVEGTNDWGFAKECSSPTAALGDATSAKGCSWMLGLGSVTDTAFVTFSSREIFER